MYLAHNCIPDSQISRKQLLVTFTYQYVVWILLTLETWKILILNFDIFFLLCVFFKTFFSCFFFLSFFKSKYHKIPIEGIKTKRDGYGDSIDSLKLNCLLLINGKSSAPSPSPPNPFFSPQAYITKHPPPHNYMY